MKARTFNYIAWFSSIVAIASWCVFGWLVFRLNDARAAYSTAQVALAQAQDEESAAGKLHATMRDTKQARDALDALANTDVLTSVDIIEKIGSQSGAKVHVEGASAAALSNQKSSKDVHAFLITATSQGKLQTLMKITSLLETLPLASSLFGLELEQLPADSQGKSSTDVWRLTIRIRIVTTSPIGA